MLERLLEREREALAREREVSAELKRIGTAGVPRQPACYPTFGQHRKRLSLRLPRKLYLDRSPRDFGNVF